MQWMYYLFGWLDSLNAKIFLLIIGTYANFISIQMNEMVKKRVIIYAKMYSIETLFCMKRFNYKYQKYNIHEYWTTVKFHVGTCSGIIMDFYYTYTLVYKF